MNFLVFYDSSSLTYPSASLPADSAECLWGFPGTKRQIPHAIQDAHEHQRASHMLMRMPVKFPSGRHGGFGGVSTGTRQQISTPRQSLARFVRFLCLTEAHPHCDSATTRNAHLEIGGEDTGPRPFSQRNAHILSIVFDWSLTDELAAESPFR